MAPGSKEPRNPPPDGAGGWGKPAPGAAERTLERGGERERERAEAPQMRDRGRDGDWRAAKEKGGGEPAPPREWQDSARRGPGGFGEGGRGGPGGYEVRHACSLV